CHDPMLSLRHFPYRCVRSLAGFHPDGSRHRCRAGHALRHADAEIALGHLQFVDVRVLEKLHQAFNDRKVHARRSAQSRKVLTRMPSASSASRTVRAIVTAAGVSLWTQIESMGVARDLPVTVSMAPARTMRTTRAAASPASWITAPGLLLCTRWPSSV